MSECPRHDGVAEERPELSLAVPCYNEADSIRNTAQRLTEAFRVRGIALELVLVDNGSSDATGSIIDEMIADGMPVVKEVVVRNEGYGNGVLRGLARCTGELVGFICADGQVEAHDVVKLYEVAAHSTAPKLVKVRRRFRMDGFKRKIVSIVFNVVANVVYGGLRSIDINGNPKIFPHSYLPRMALTSKDWFLDAEVMIKAKRLGLSVFEMNVIAQMREEGVSHVRSSTIWEFVRNLLRWRVSRRAGRSSDRGGVRDREGASASST